MNTFQMFLEVCGQMIVLGLCFVAGASITIWAIGLFND